MSVPTWAGSDEVESAANISGLPGLAKGLQFEGPNISVGSDCVLGCGWIPRVRTALISGPTSSRFVLEPESVGDITEVSDSGAVETGRACCPCKACRTARAW
ncbi:Protein of unknown function [Pyronema omphalodes CBS 100304]|uniref:Uncharacterized protein n=1 Tax=Pyronema omphalodes (strain CBS 100304) TaxID=1076935 RepID=U4LUR1_PYROM|nr:Protein of unknown function [Pyronema omphalodes CBS 100304]